MEEFSIWYPNLEKSLNFADWIIYSHPKLIDFINPNTTNLPINKIETNIQIFNEISTKQIKYISNGCDYDYFIKAKEKIYPKPIEIPNTDKLILGYYGAFSHWIDWDLIKFYADNSLYHIVMIGGIENNPNYNISFEHTNITWISHKPYNELINYLSWFDVCFLPFKKIKLNEYVNPCKLWEYIATSKPILMFGIDLIIPIDYDTPIKWIDMCNQIKILIN